MEVMVLKVGQEAAVVVMKCPRCGVLVLDGAEIHSIFRAGGCVECVAKRGDPPAAESRPCGCDICRQDKFS